ncbi:hypothetical protein EV207_10823 [Scopulibacillus darangshiensis]|uniref:Uncharacterized protein n=1 Tax=Scopulibacillus darangshiensis TaxID=442528 RepID=A0A4R2P4P6_9BACL|nr:hypothetical protein [Scopulibacillus darangshiensis]TCP29732.1 hypothetical protein EV207_10823 [Scopulibacillus darangshiensis]
MNRTTGVLKMHFRDRWSWIFTPWIILLTSFIINYIIGLAIGGREDLYTGGIASIYIYMLVAALVTLPHTFSFMLGFSVRRKDYFFGTVLTFLVISAFTAALLFLLSLAEKLTGAWGVNLHFFHLPYLNDGPVAEQLWTSFTLFLEMFFLGFVIASVYRRFRRSGMIVLVIAALIIFSVGGFLCTYNNWWVSIFHWIGSHTAFQLSLWLFPTVVIYIILSYLMLRRATV